MFPKLNKVVMNNIQEIIIQSNPYVQTWMQTGIKIRQHPDIDLKIVLEKKKNDKTYNLPTCDEVALLLVPGQVAEETMKKNLTDRLNLPQKTIN